MKRKRVERATAEARKVAKEKRLTEEFWIREDVDSDSQIHDSSTSIKNESLHEKKVIHSTPRDELKLELKVHDASAENNNSILAKSETDPPALMKKSWGHDQAKQLQEYKGGFKISSPYGLTISSSYGLKRESHWTVNDGFNKVKTFDLRGVQSSGSAASREENN